MTSKALESIPLACVAGAIPAAERPAHFALIQRLFGETAIEQHPLPSGYAFRFPADAFVSLSRFVANERKCCPFLAFTIEVSPGEGSIELRLTGPAGTQEFLALQLPQRATG